MTATLDRSAFYVAIRKPLFSGRMSASQVAGIEAILDACPAIMPTEPLAYCFATVHHETDRTMQPIKEYGFGKGKAYGKPAGPYKQIYAGRGLVQLTWLAGYETANDRLHKLGLLTDAENLVKTPDLALRPDIASAILFHGMIEGWFTGKKLSGYFGHGKSNPKGARAIINGTDKASLIVGYFTHYRNALKAAGHGTAPVEPTSAVELPTSAPIVLTSAVAVAKAAPAPGVRKAVPVKKRAAPVAHIIKRPVKR